MPSNVIWCTESVDNSAMFLAQALDATLVKDVGLPEDFPILMEDDLNVIFYGAVKIPEWFENDFFNEDTMFNDPRKAKKLLNKAQSLHEISSHLQIAAVKYFPVKGKSWTALRETLGTSTIDLVKANGVVAATVKNSGEYNANLTGIKYAMKHLGDVSGRYRIFAGKDSITQNGIICISHSAKKKLSYKETLMYNLSPEAKAAIEGLFHDGLIEDNPDKGVVAWSEIQTTSSFDGVNNVSGLGMGVAKERASKILDYFEIDFCAIDCINVGGVIYVTNITSCPSIQETDILLSVAPYFKELLTTGRKITKEHLLTAVMSLNDNEIAQIGNILKGMGKKLTKTA